MYRFKTVFKICIGLRQYTRYVSPSVVADMNHLHFDSKVLILVCVRHFAAVVCFSTPLIIVISNSIFLFHQCRKLYITAQSGSIILIVSMLQVWIHAMGGQWLDLRPEILIRHDKGDALSQRFCFRLPISIPSLLRSSSSSNNIIVDFVLSYF